ncbi:MAG: hypothetical protein V1816_00790 [Pseudomonadota bacterium]
MNKSSLVNVPEQKIYAKMDKESFKSMFYLFAGKPDSKVRLFNRRVLVYFDDLLLINQNIIEKLKLHQIDIAMSTAIIKFDKKESIEFGTWIELEEYDFKIPSVTQEITLRWDFLINVSNFQIPQRHTLTVRLTTKPSTKEFLQALFSSDSDDDFDFETKLGLCMVRVDFISHVLADELINVVEKWNNGLKQPDSACDWFCELEKIDKWIVRIIHYSTPSLVVFVACVLLGVLLPESNAQVTVSQLLVCIRWLLISFLCLYVTINFCRHLGMLCYEAINQYGIFAPFQLTRGDLNLTKKLDKNNKKKINAFLIHSGFSLFLNIIAGMIVWYLLKLVI